MFVHAIMKYSKKLNIQIIIRQRTDYLGKILSMMIIKMINLICYFPYIRINRPTTPDKNIINALIIRDTVVFPRIVTLIRNGTKPRKV